MFFKFQWPTRLLALGIAAFVWYVLYVNYQATLAVLAPRHMPGWEVLVRFFSSYTTAAALLTGLVTSYVALRPSSRLPHPRFLSSFGAYSIATIVIAWWLADKNLGIAEPAFQANQHLTLFIPATYLAFWLLCVQKGRLSFADPVGWLAFPAIFIMGLIYFGSQNGFYPYPELAANRLERLQVFINADIILACFFVIGLCLVAMDRLMIGWRGEEEEWD